MNARSAFPGILLLLCVCAFGSTQGLPAWIPASCADTDGTLMGINLAGANFGLQYSDWPGKYGREYIFPSAGELDYYAGKGLTLVRLPFSWSRVQPKLFEPLDPVQVGYIRNVVNSAFHKGMRVVLDSHDFARYRAFADETVIGSAEVPIQAFEDFWTRMAVEFRDVPGIAGYDIENEPHDMGGPDVWPRAAQAAVDGIRSVDRETAIVIEGDGWSNAAHWSMFNEQLAITDPADRIIYSAHAYFDRDGSGTYKGSYDREHAYPDVGVDRLRPFADWLRRRGFRGMVGEYGVPGDDPRWLVVLDRFLAALRREAMPGTYWAGGPWWGNNRLSVEPAGDRERPQMAILARYPTACAPRDPAGL